MPKFTEDLLRFDRDADVERANVLSAREEILRAAREESLKIVQEAELIRGKARETAIKAQDAANHRRKDEMVMEAKRRAQLIKVQASEKTADAVTLIIERVYVEAEK